MSSMESKQISLVSRLWHKDLSLWGSEFGAVDDVANWLGWLDAVPWMESNIAAISTWADQVIHSKQFDVVILLGMGGSSLAAEVFYSTFGKTPGYLRLIVLDTTSPDQIKALDVDLRKSLIIVASKSGTTVETADLFAFLYGRISDYTDNPGSHFVAITDSDSWLDQEGEVLGFAKIFRNPSDIGGRYAALSFFGLVPASLIGVDLQILLEHTRLFVESSRSGVAQSQILNLAKLLAEVAMSEAGLVELRLSQSVQPLAIWIEQLLAESTGKNGLGIIPIYNDPAIGQRFNKCQSSVYVDLPNADCNDKPGELKFGANMGWTLSNRYDLGGEFLRWEMATALAASIMGVNPFDQPNVEESKIITRRIIENKVSPDLNLIQEFDDYDIYSGVANILIAPAESFCDLLSAFRNTVTGSTYLGVLAFLPMFNDVDLQLKNIRSGLSSFFKLNTTLGYGPRYLHSTGQLHKGGPGTGCFVQITEQAMANIEIPERQYGFEDLHRAQADGDFSVLAGKNLPVMRIALKGDRLWVLEKLATDLRAYMNTSINRASSKGSV